MTADPRIVREFEAEGVLVKAADICRRVADEADDIDADSKEMRVLANCLRSIHKACDVPRFAEAGLELPEPARHFYMDGKNGKHTEHLGFLLAEMQYLPRAYPDATW